jgi:hypothetical protein
MKSGWCEGAVLSCALAVTTGVLAPSGARAADDVRGAFVSVQGGGYSPLRDLDDAGTASFKTGYMVGGSVGYQFTRHVAVRGSFSFARTEADAPLRSFDGSKFNRFFYDADVQLRYPTDGGLSPYVFVGGGGVTVDNAVSFAKGAGKFGVGLSYDFKDSGFGVFVEGTGWMYDFEDHGFDKTQVDVAWTGGIVYRLGR